MKHTIAFFDGDTLIKEKLADELPESMRFANDDKGDRVPIVRVVARTSGDLRELFSYGPAGQLLSVTRQARVT